MGRPVCRTCQQIYFISDGYGGQMDGTLLLLFSSVFSFVFTARAHILLSFPFRSLPVSLALCACSVFCPHFIRSIVQTYIRLIRNAYPISFSLLNLYIPVLTIYDSRPSSSQQPGKFETYVCVEGHPCVMDLSDNHFCFVWSEVDEVFVPWVSTLVLKRERQ